MAVIVLEIPNVAGESQITGYADKVEALSIRDTIEVAVAQGTGGGRNPGRTVGQSKHSDIEVTRHKDRASPKLAQACSSGQNLGEVKIHLFRTIESGTVVYMTYTLTETFVSRIEQETGDANGVGYQPHLGWSPPYQGVTTPSPNLGVVSMVATLGTANRLAPIPMAPEAAGAVNNTEIERVWLNAASVKWTYTPYTNGVKGGAVEKGWNIQTGASL